MFRGHGRCVNAGHVAAESSVGLDLNYVQVCDPLTTVIVTESPFFFFIDVEDVVTERSFDCSCGECS